MPKTNKPRKRAITVAEAMAVLGRYGAKARQKKVSPERRREIAIAAITARWDRYRARQAAAAKQERAS